MGSSLAPSLCSHALRMLAYMSLERPCLMTEAENILVVAGAQAGILYSDNLVHLRQILI